MFRLKIAAVVGGAVLAFFGVQEYRVSSGSTAEPVEVDLAAVERGEIEQNTHWRLGEHIAVYAGCVYQYRQSKYDTGEPGASTRVDYCYYPVLSFEHPFIKQNVSGEVDSEGEYLSDFSVMVKTKEFDTIGDIPDDLLRRDEVQGLIVNLVTGLDSEEKELLRQNFPSLDVDKLLLLEKGREPASLAKSLGMLLGGLVIAGGGITLLVSPSDE